MNRAPLLLAMTSLLCSLAYAREQEDQDGIVCEQVTIPVKLATSQPARDFVRGEFCARRGELTAGMTVQLLIHGATYNHRFWDFGDIGGVRYSYAHDVAARGIPTLAIDEIGTGSSSHPDSALLTIDVVAYVTHQVVEALRRGDLVRVPFGKIITVGHSLGSVVAWAEAISYADVDGIIVTGATHSSLSRLQGQARPSLYPAAEDAAFAGGGLDSGYLTTIPNTRTVFHSSPDVDPAVMAQDEQAKDVVSATELISGYPLLLSTATQAIEVPVLIIIGSEDRLNCGANEREPGALDCTSAATVAIEEKQYYAPQALLHVCILPASGHDVALAINQNIQVADTVAWSFAFVGQMNRGKSEVVGPTVPAMSWNHNLPWNCQ